MKDRTASEMMRALSAPRSAKKGTATILLDMSFARGVLVDGAWIRGSSLSGGEK